MLCDKATPSYVGKAAMGKLKAKMTQTQLPDFENGIVNVQFNLSILLLPASLREVIHEEQHHRNPHCTRHGGLDSGS